MLKVFGISKIMNYRKIWTKINRNPARNN